MEFLTTVAGTICQSGVPYFLVCRILSLTNNTAACVNSGTICMSHTLKTQGLLIMIYIQNVVNLIASLIRSLTYFLRTQNVDTFSSVNNSVGYWPVSRVTSFQWLSIWNLFPGKNRRAVITHKKFKYCCSSTLYKITLHNVACTTTFFPIC